MDHSSRPSISSNGGFIAFQSRATDLENPESDRWIDVFVHYRMALSTEKISSDPTGMAGNDHSFEPSISRDGRFIAFHSDASNLVVGDTNGVTDVFVYDRVTKLMERVSIGTDGEQGDAFSTFPEITADGRFVVFHSEARTLVPGDTNNEVDVFVRDRGREITELVSIGNQAELGNDASAWPDISADGRFVVFGSLATNLVMGDTNESEDIFVHDRDTRLTTRISLFGGSEAATRHTWSNISADGRYVSFVSLRGRAVPGLEGFPSASQVFRYDRQSGQTLLFSRNERGEPGLPGGPDGAAWGSWVTALSADGRFFAFDSFSSNLVPNDTNDASDVFVAWLE